MLLDFENLNVNETIKSVLKQYHIDFVFQPVFSKDEELIGYEALMRPEGKQILDFIQKMKEKEKLHELELLTFFGATMAYRQRGYHTKLGIRVLAEGIETKEEYEFLKSIDTDSYQGYYLGRPE